jgi:hypothetical protein
MLGDLPDVDVAPPDNVRRVCMLVWMLCMLVWMLVYVGVCTAL